MTKTTAFDPTAWYVAETKRNQELTCLRILNDLPEKTVDYPVEAYVASQQEVVRYANRTRRIKEHIIIRGKIFIRVDEQHRQDLLKQCLFLTRFVKDPSLTRTASGFTAFARVPDREIQVLRDILRMADGPVEYTDERPQSGDQIQVLTGQFSGLKGKIDSVSGSRSVLVILDQLGTFRFRLPISSLGKIKS